MAGPGREAAGLGPPRPFSAGSSGAISGEALGEGPPVVLCHGLTATRRYVVHGSKALARRGYRQITYDARGHGRSLPADGYSYSGLADDLDLVIEAATGNGDGPLVVGGHSMGAHTALCWALRDPDRVAALILIGPAYTGPESVAEEGMGFWDRRAEALERGGPEEFGRVVGADVTSSEQARSRAVRLATGRAELHEHPEAVARALREVPRSRPFEDLSGLGGLRIPCLVVASNDEDDPEHPEAVARAYAEALPEASLVRESPGQSPLAWQGGRLSREIAGFLAQRGL